MCVFRRITSNRGGVSQPLSNKFANMGLICAGLVVFIHTYPACTPGDLTWWVYHAIISDGVARIAVPFFFVASGFFLAGHCNKVGWWKNEIRKRIQSLLIPYFSWSTINFIYVVMLSIVANNLAHVEWTRNLPLTLTDWLNVYGLTLGPRPLMKVLWFVRWLFFMVLLSPFFIKILRLRRINIIYLIALLLVWIIFEPIISTAASCWQIISLLGLFFFNVGLYLRLFDVLLTAKFFRLIGLFSFLIGMLLFITMNYGELHNLAWMKYFYMPAIVLTLVGVWCFVPTVQWPKTLTSCAFPIYLLHCFFLTVFAILKKYMPYPSGVLEYFLSASLAIGASIIVSIMLRKLFPQGATFLFGGR